MNSKRKVLRIAHVVGKMVGGGVEQTIMNYYKYIDKDLIQYDFIVDNDSTYVPVAEITSRGGRIIYVPPYQNVFNYIVTLKKIFLENDYQIVHSHLNTLSVFPLFAAYLANVPYRIAHNHSTAGKGELKKNIIKYALRPFSRVFPTNLCACSKYAGEWLFGKKEVEKGNVKIWKNALEIEEFSFNKKMREQVRDNMNLENAFVIGHVGRFIHQKNHFFLLDVFDEIHKIDNSSVLVLVGEGVLENEVRKIVKEKNLEEQVIFMGNRKDVANLYQAMDIFIFPSFYEGLGMVAVEAEIAGLQVYCSENIPIEAKISENFTVLPLTESPKKWAEKIIQNRTYERKSMSENASKCGYDIKKAAFELSQWYFDLVDGEKNEN